MKRNWLNQPWGRAPLNETLEEGRIRAIVARGGSQVRRSQAKLGDKNVVLVQSVNVAGEMTEWLEDAK